MKYEPVQTIVLTSLMLFYHQIRKMSLKPDQADYCPIMNYYLKF